MKMHTNTRKTRSTELAMEDNPNSTDSKVQEIVGQRVTLLRPEILTKGEHILYETRPLPWPPLVRPALWIAVGIAIAIIAPQIQLEFIRAFIEQIPLDLIRLIIRWTGIVLSLTALLGTLIRYLRQRYTVYAITNHRLLEQTGILGKSYADCSLSKIQNVYIDVTVSGRIFGFGTLRVATAGIAKTEIHWKHLKEPIKVHRELNEAIRQSIRDIAQN